MPTGSVWEGIVIGASAGLISGVTFAVLAGFKDAIQHRLRRREQVGYLSSTIRRYRDMIFGATEITYQGDLTGQYSSADQVRKAHLDDMYRQVKSIVLERSDLLSFDEKQEVISAFGLLNLSPQWAPNDAGYAQIFDAIESIAWLRLAPRVQRS